MKGFFMKGTGLLLLLLGAGLIAYTFNASDSVNSAVNQAIHSANSVLSQIRTSLPPGNILWLLLGGSGAVVLGMTMIFKRAPGNKS
jgi:hypothetical protein